MFSGLVQQLGTVRKVVPVREGLDMTVAAQLATSASVGDSIAVNGVCLTIAQLHAQGSGEPSFSATIVPETLERTTLGTIKAQERVNLEAALRAGDRLGGHIVQGHVDGVARVSRSGPEGEAWRLTISPLPQYRDLMRWVAQKGSIAIDGVSLTVAAVSAEALTVALVPHTLAQTTLGRLKIGDSVNLETDILAKHVERLLSWTRS